jgi:hypothetical protein
MFDLTCADAKRKRSECAVRTGVTIATHNRHPRLRQSQFRTNHMHDALLGGIDIEESDVELATILTQYGNLFGSEWIRNWEGAISRWNIVIYSGYREIWPSHRAIIFTQTVEGLRRSYFVNQVKIDEKQCRMAQLLPHDMCVPEFFKQCAWFGYLFLHF